MKEFSRTAYQFCAQHFFHEQQSEHCSPIGGMDLSFALLGKVTLFFREHASALITEKNPHCICIDGHIMEFIPAIDDIAMRIQCALQGQHGFLLNDSIYALRQHSAPPFCANRSMRRAAC